QLIPAWHDPLHSCPHVPLGAGTQRPDPHSGAPPGALTQDPPVPVPPGSGASHHPMGWMDGWPNTAQTNPSERQGPAPRHSSTAPGGTHRLCVPASSPKRKARQLAPVAQEPPAPHGSTHTPVRGAPLSLGTLPTRQKRPGSQSASLPHACISKG